MPLTEARPSRRALNAITGPRALGWQVGVWALGATSVLNLLSDPYVDFRSSFNLGLAPFLASVPALLLMLGINAITRGFSRGRYAIVLLTYVVVAGVRPLFLFVFVSAIDPTDTTNPLLRPLGSVVTIGILLVVSFTNNVVSLFQDGMARASVTRERLSGALALAQSELQRPVPRLDDSVRSVITGIVDDIRQQLASRHSHAELQTLADEVTTSSAKRVRNLSHEFSQRWSMAQIPEFPPAHRAYTRDLFRASVGPNSYFPVLVSLLTAGAMSYGLVPRSDNGASAIGVISAWFVITAAGLIVARTVHRRIWATSEANSARQTVFFYGSTLAVAELASALSGILGTVLPGSPEVTPVTQFFTVPLVALAVGIAVAMGAGLMDASRTLLAQAQATNREIERVLVRVNAQRLHTQGAVSQFLHGRVQGQLMAASLLVHTHLDAGEPVAQVRERIESLLDDITVADLDAVEPPAIDHGVSALLHPWEGMLDVDTQIDERTRGALDNDVLARSIFFDVLSEAVNNAIKHAKSQRVTVVASMSGDDECLVAISNDGMPWSQTGSAGLGIRSLESVTTSLSIETVGGETTLRVSIPVAPVAS